MPIVAFTLVCGCDGGERQPSPAPTKVALAATVVPAQRNVAMGAGEARNPEPFTVERRLLDAISRNDRATIDRALQLGAPLTAKDDLGRGPVFLATMDAGDVELVRWLHTKGAALDETDVTGRAALSFAAADGRLDIVRYLVENRAVVDRPDVQKRTPLFHAAIADRPAVVAYLHERGADLNARDQFGDTPLIAACARGNAATATFLIEHGADSTLKDQEGRTARERSAPGVASCERLGPA